MGGRDWGLGVEGHSPLRSELRLDKTLSQIRKIKPNCYVRQQVCLFLYRDSHFFSSYAPHSSSGKPEGGQILQARSRRSLPSQTRVPLSQKRLWLGWRRFLEANTIHHSPQLSFSHIHIHANVSHSRAQRLLTRMQLTLTLPALPR